MSDYTPHTGEIRDAVSGGWDYAYITPKEFDRWLAAHDAEVRADEREKAAQRVARVRFWTEWGESSEYEVCNWNSAIAAARGDGEQE